MFQKITKHRANDASNDVHRPPLQHPRQTSEYSKPNLFLRNLRYEIGVDVLPESLEAMVRVKSVCLVTCD